MAAYLIRSMTGYARETADSPWGELQLELRTVNHRYLDVTVKLPEELRALENTLRNRLKDKLGRGKVEAYLRLRSDRRAAPLDLDESALEQLLLAMQKVQASLPDAAMSDAISILRWPGVLNEQEPDLSVLGQVFEELAGRAIQSLCETRAAEGERLAEVLESRLAGIETLIEQVLVRLPVQTRLWREKLQQRMEEMIDMEPERREQALVQFVQRLDVDEEIERLKSHVTAVRDVLQSGEPVGRKLDFFMQEFNREANTLGSKSMDAELTRLAVELKVLIEQMREQVQNIE